METWILLVWIAARQHGPQASVPTPILWDFSSRAECEKSAAEFIGYNEQQRIQATQSFERYGYAGDMERNYRCIWGPRR